MHLLFEALPDVTNSAQLEFLLPAMKDDNALLLLWHLQEFARKL